MILKLPFFWTARVVDEITISSNVKASLMMDILTLAIELERRRENANKWCGTFTNGRILPFILFFHVLFNV